MKIKSIALALCAIMLFSLSACSDKPAANIKAGTYTAKEKGYGGEVSATVTVDSEGKMTDLKIEGAGETADVGGKAIPKITETLLNDQTVKVDVVTGATVTSNAALAAVTAALKLSGVDTESMKAPVKTGADSEKTAEIVIVGCGASGMTAALAAAEKGAKVIVVEQTSSYGGTALMGAEGFFAVGSEQQKKAGDTTTTDDMYDWFMEYNHEKSYSPLTRSWLEMTAGTVDWLAAYGNPATLMENTQLAHTDQIKTYHKFDDKVTGFASMYDNMLKMGVEVIFDTKVTDLILDSAGKAVGIIGTKNDGGKLKVNSEAVIL
jgi:fumarate reductase flavoprotein subunit